jgi:hypothetical protein
MSDVDRARALERLEVFVGEWEAEAVFSPDRGVTRIRGRSVFEWALAKTFLVQRSDAEDPVPDSVSIFAVNPDGNSYTQHYFDARGVVRLYQMTFDGRDWTLSRHEADFTPLDFDQRFVATFEEGGASIRGRWEIRHPGQDWEHDFEVVYTRA